MINTRLIINKNNEIQLFNQIQSLNLRKTNSKKVNRGELYLFHLINDYFLDYKKSKNKEKAFKSNTLESLEKGITI